MTFKHGIQTRIFMLILGSMFGFGFSQMPETGDFYYLLYPRQAQVGQPVKFEAKEFSGCQSQFTTTFTLEPTPISSKRTYIIRLLSKKLEGCGLAFGYSGPIVIFENLQTGVYKIQFDSLSEFKKDLGDTNSFEIVAGSAIFKKNAEANKTGIFKLNGNKSIRLDGKIISKKRLMFRESDPPSKG